MLLALALLMDILPNGIDGFAMHPLDEASLLPPLTNNKLEDCFPGLAVLAFKYFMVKDKCNRPANQQLAARSMLQEPRSNQGPRCYPSILYLPITYKLKTS
jgi:hypothetical protein